GSVAWHVSHGYGTGFNGSDLVKIAVDGSGNVYTTGNFSGTVDFNPGPGTYNLSTIGTKKTSATSSVYVLELNNSGGFLWAGALGTDTSTWETGIAIDGAGSVYLTGNYTAATTTSDFDPGSGARALPGSGTYVEKLSASHNLLWAQSNTASCGA